MLATASALTVTTAELYVLLAVTVILIAAFTAIVLTDPKGK